jgi:hypothetical protein
MTIKTYEKDEKDPNRPESKPERLAKIMYEGIVRYTKAKNALKRGGSRGFELDFDRLESVNVPAKDI